MQPNKSPLSSMTSTMGRPRKKTLMTEQDEVQPVPEYHRGGVVAWHEPDTLGQILAIARTAGCAPCTKIKMRSTTWQRIFNESNHTLDPEAVTAEEGIPIIIDDTLPLFPGFEIHREVW
jgi:hypothetical protein